MAVSDTESATLETNPVPNHNTTIGASAIFGTLLMATMKGSTSRATNTEYQSASPISDPTMVPIHLALADVYVRLSQPALAVQALRAGLAALPGSPELTDRLSRLEQR